MAKTIEKEMQPKKPYGEQVIGAMNVAKEYLDVLSKIELTDEVRVVNAIEAAHKLSAQLSVFSLRERKIPSADIADRLKKQVLDNKSVKYEAIDRYRLADQLPGASCMAQQGS